MTNFPDAISVLSAMITPAVLISACGSLILATSDRLSKAVMRTREISIALIPRSPDQRSDGREEERRMLFTQLDFVTTRSRLLQRALSRLYAALVKGSVTVIAKEEAGRRITGHVNIGPAAILEVARQHT